MTRLDAAKPDLEEGGCVLDSVHPRREESRHEGDRSVVVVRVDQEVVQCRDKHYKLDLGGSVISIRCYVNM